jgi:hypothetical protein
MPATLTTETEETRRIKRISLTLPMRVEGKDDPSNKWDEITRLKDISPFGAGFTLKRPVKRGRLVQLTLPMPRQMRCYDYVESQYRVWGIVRRCLTLENKSYFIGVAFIGKAPPRSYMEDPARIYEISHRAEEGLWQIRSAESNPDESNLPKEDRRHSRYGIPVNMMVEVIDQDGNVIKRESTVSENISLGGAAVFTTLNIQEGSYIRVTCSQYDAAIKAIVRGKRIGPDGIPRLHIEFIDNFFPLEGIDL